MRGGWLVFKNVLPFGMFTTLCCCLDAMLSHVIVSYLGVGLELGLGFIKLTYSSQSSMVDLGKSCNVDITFAHTLYFLPVQVFIGFLLGGGRGLRCLIFFDIFFDIFVHIFVHIFVIYRCSRRSGRRPRHGRRGGR